MGLAILSALRVQTKGTSLEVLKAALSPPVLNTLGQRIVWPLNLDDTVTDVEIFATR